MKIHTQSDIEKLVLADAWMMDVLHAAATLRLSDWWIGAGFLRNKVWDAIEGNKSKPPKDVDLVYFNGKDTKPETDWNYDKQLKQDYSFAEWEVRNQARMHYVNNFDPYTSTADGIAHWVETATCVAVKLEGDKLQFLFCHGLDDLVGLTARPSPTFQRSDLLKIFYDRLEQKHWRQRWPHLQVII